MRHDLPLVDDNADVLPAKDEAPLEMARLQARDRERLARDMEVLQHRISRDLKRPIQSVARASRLLLEHHGEVFDPKAKSILEDALESISEMQSLVDEILGRVGTPGASPATDKP